MSKRVLAFVSLAVLAISLVWAQEQNSQNGSQDMPNHHMSNMDTSAHNISSANSSDMPDMPGMSSDGSAHAMHSMEGHHMDMGPHMKMTAVRDLKPGDEDRATQVVDAARKAADKYADYKNALADGYKIFLPNLPQK